jgi:hypothetical protein
VEGHIHREGCEEGSHKWTQSVWAKEETRKVGLRRGNLLHIEIVLTTAGGIELLIGPQVEVETVRQTPKEG